jgi:F0F1-type ATP synthase delta subunit
MLTFNEFQSKLTKLVEIARESETLNEFIEGLIDNEGQTFTVEEVVTGDISGITLPLMGIKRIPPTNVILDPTALKFIKNHVRTFRNRFTHEESEEILKTIASIMQQKGRFGNGKSTKEDDEDS